MKCTYTYFLPFALTMLSILAFPRIISASDTEDREAPPKEGTQQSTDEKKGAASSSDMNGSKSETTKPEANQAPSKGEQKQASKEEKQAPSNDSSARKSSDEARSSSDRLSEKDWKFEGGKLSFSVGADLEGRRRLTWNNSEFIVTDAEITLVNPQGGNVTRSRLAGDSDLQIMQRLTEIPASYESESCEPVCCEPVEIKDDCESSSVSYSESEYVPTSTTTYTTTYSEEPVYTYDADYYDSGPSVSVELSGRHHRHHRHHHRHHHRR